MMLNTAPASPLTPPTLEARASSSGGDESRLQVGLGSSMTYENAASLLGTRPISLLREDFVLGDEWSTNHITVDDALSHRTGYPRHDPAVTGSARNSVRNLRNLPMSAEPQAGYQYSNKITEWCVSHPTLVASDVEGTGSITFSVVFDYAKYLPVMVTEAGVMSKAGHRELKTPRMLKALFPQPFI
ncbi:hypothetical protein DL762_002021 [Monosporascus cannonballus]|uniref:Beta-lactamase-related domain-containing protein n=1 Tax=Monosporascus cannonballus TaxID=155416 RepID=A0ABY0HFD5_9PEZI|nr:hypothetical protein DL762_002021 [Monosporascus cannonballus]